MNAADLVVDCPRARALAVDLLNVVCCAVRRYLLIVDSMTWVFFFTAFGMIGMVNFPTVSSMKSQKCSPAEQGQVRTTTYL